MKEVVKLKIAAEKRKINYDLIRVLACASVLVFHYNASVCGFDTGTSPGIEITKPHRSILRSTEI